MIWAVPSILLVAGFLAVVLAQGAASTWMWATGSILGLLLLIVGAGVLGILVLLVH